MDAPEDRDVKLQKVSADLFSEFSTNLPKLLYRSTDDSQLRHDATQKELEALVAVLEPFQESPQLLDPHLSTFLPPLTSSFLRFITTLNTHPTTASKLTLLEAIAKLLYTFSKIRGSKIISRFLPNEPKWMEPLISVFYSPPEVTGIERSWELRYILLLWLGHLCLAPFDLKTISASDSPMFDELEIDVGDLPGVAKRMLILGRKYLASPGNREAEAAAGVIVRLALRRDMRELGLLDKIVDWALSILTSEDFTSIVTSSFLKTGVLKILAGFLAQGEKSSVGSFVEKVFETISGIEDAEKEEWKSGTVRQLIVKLYRWIALLSLGGEAEDLLVEDIITRLLNSLGDRDTAVRLGASKSLAVIARKLDPDAAGEVLEAVMAMFEEDIFLTAPPEKRKIFTAVQPERWHGATLTLATFLRQRAVRSTEVLERVVGCILDALTFEQRRATFALGGNVRDAACYASWSLARSYTTNELNAVGKIAVPGGDPKMVLQLLATSLVVAGCLDPLGNIRRAASAALQELVGRHPGCVLEGIRVVQIVDYNAVALRRRSVIEVAREAASLGVEYWEGLVDGIVAGWRGVASSDTDGRKMAGRGLGALVAVEFNDGSEVARGRSVVTSLVKRIRSEGKGDIEIWHGGIWALAEVVDSMIAAFPTDNTLFTEQEIPLLLEKTWEKLQGKEFINPILRPELTAEAASRLVLSLVKIPHCLHPGIQHIRLWTAIVDVSLDRTDETVLEQAVPAAHFLFNILNEKNKVRLLESIIRRILDASKKPRGHVLALGQLTSYLPPSPSSAEIDNVSRALVSAATRVHEVELRVAGIRAIGKGLLARGVVNDVLIQTLLGALDDYDVDSRGDVGSWVRAEALETVRVGWNSLQAVKWEVLGKVVRLAAERLERVRGRACGVLAELLDGENYGVELRNDVSVGSVEYFTALLPLLLVEQLQLPLLAGYVTSSGGGSDSTIKSSTTALLTYISTLPLAHQESISNSIITLLETNVPNDRVLIPALETIGIILEMAVLSPFLATPEGIKWSKKLAVTVMKAQYKSGNVLKLQAALRVYGGLMLSVEREEAVKVWSKCVGMMAHPFPKIREGVAEMLWFVLLKEEGNVARKAGDVLEAEDWMGKPAKLVGRIGELKRILGV
ncbi:hypothetical protein RUND412_010467 [Rhizina undulata]